MGFLFFVCTTIIQAQHFAGPGIALCRCCDIKMNGLKADLLRADNVAVLIINKHTLISWQVQINQTIEIGIWIRLQYFRMGCVMDDIEQVQKRQLVAKVFAIKQIEFVG